MNRAARVEPTPPECALAAEMFDHFCSAGIMKQILALHREICNTLNLKPNRLPDFYPKLKAKLASSWKAQALFKKFDARANHKVYAKGRVCAASKILIIGAGPCGLRAAIECQLLGAKVVVIEKRDRISRNNVLHLWPFVIHDLKALGAKKFFGKFCAGSIDHISIRQLQCILLKVALLLGVEFHEGVSFEELLQPTVTENLETLGWRARVLPADHPVSQYEFDCLMGADGKRNTLHGFKRKEFRGKLAMAITANFINRHSEQEASVPEISGVAFIFNQKFFKELYAVTGIDLENIVYYKDETHYFVMTAKKHSLLDKGVLLNDYAEVSRLLSVENVDRAALMRYAQEAARFSTDGRLPLKDFALNHYGEPDVALFDFTSMYAAENASMVYERSGRRLLCQLVGDSLLEPFWPTGSGCARGFLSALDAAWAVRIAGQTPQPHPLQLIADRESIYRLLAQTTPENLQRDFGAYTLDPCTRYPNLNRSAVTPHKVTSFYDSDEPLPLDAVPTLRKRRREVDISEEALVRWVDGGEGGVRAAVSAPALAALVRRYRPDLLPPDAPPPTVYAVLQRDLGIVPFATNGQIRDVAEAKLRSYLTRIYFAFKGEVPHIHHESDVFDQIKQSQQKEKHSRNTADHSLAMYSNAADAEKSHSSYRKKRRAVRTPQVSTDPAEYIRKKIGKLDLNEISQLAQLIDGHDNLQDERHTDKQKSIQEQIIALLDPDESPDPSVLRESIATLLQGTSKTKLQESGGMTENNKLAGFFGEGKSEQKPTRPPRRLKGLDVTTIKYPDFSNMFPDDSTDTDVTIKAPTLQKMEFHKSTSVEKAPTPKKKEFHKSASVDIPKKNQFVKSLSTEGLPKGRRLSDLTVCKNRHSQSPEAVIKGRSSSIGGAEAQNTRRIAEIFEGHKRRYTPSPDARPHRSPSVGNPDMILRQQRMAEIIGGKRQTTPSPDRSRQLQESIGFPEMALRRQRVVDLIEGHKQRYSPEPNTQRRNSGEISFRMQRASDMMQRRAEKRPKGGGKRRAARDIMKQRFEKSLQMLASEPVLTLAPSADLENDVGLQQYRANAPHFDERVKKLEKKLQHYEEGKLVGVGARAAGGGARVARLAAELSGTHTVAVPKSTSKPKDLMRSVGKIERDDWNVKEIERKIMENRMGRPEPKTAEKVPKWDREQFLGRQRRLKDGDPQQKWGDIDETLQKFDQKLRDSGRPDLGTKKVANLATKFVKKDEPQPVKQQPKEEIKKNWRGPMSTPRGMQCAACGTQVFAAEAVSADGLPLHRACFRCAVCKAVLRPGNYTMERFGTRLICLRHRHVPDAPEAPDATPAPAATPERISLEASDSCAREIDEDEWTDRNFLASETSGAGGLSDDDASSSDEYTDANASDVEDARSPSPEPRPGLPAALYLSDDSFPYDDYSSDGAESSGNESCSRMREAREARRREVPADSRPPVDSSEVESEEESESSEEEVSSGTEVSTDSEFGREESAPPPAILVTKPASPAPPAAAPPTPHAAPSGPAPLDYPLSRARSAGGLATKRALELKRKYLLGEPSPPSVRKSESTSQLDNKLEAFRTNITEFQKMLHPAPTQPTVVQPLRPTVAFQFSVEHDKSQQMPDIIKNLCEDAPVDLLTKGDSPLCKKEWKEETIKEEKSQDKADPDLDTDSLSDTSHTDTMPNQYVPRVEIHDEGGELIQLDSLTLVSSETEEKASNTPTVTGSTVMAVESESSESCRDATTLALTETELSDWAPESAVLEDCAFGETSDNKRNKIPRALSGPKSVHDAKNISAISSHVCGRTSPAQSVVYSNAIDHFEFADEGDEDPSLETPGTPKNEGYMEFVDEDYDAYTPNNDRSMNFIERSFSETVVKHVNQDNSHGTASDSAPVIEPEVKEEPKTDSESKSEDVLKTPQLLKSLEMQFSDTSSESALKNESVILDIDISRSRSNGDTSNSTDDKSKSASLSNTSPPLEVTESIPSRKPVPPKSIDLTTRKPVDDISPPLAADTPKAKVRYVDGRSQTPTTFSTPCEIRVYSPAMCRSASGTFNRSTSRSTDSPRSMEMSISINLSSGSVSPVSPTPTKESLVLRVNKVQEIKRERDEQTEVVRRLVLERLGSSAKVNRKSTRRARVPTPTSSVPPPVPPPPVLTTTPLPETPRSSLDIPPPPPRPAPPLMPLPVVPSFSDPELARARRRRSIMKSISNYLNRRLGPRQKEPAPTLSNASSAHKSTGALQDAPPVPPPPAGYRPPAPSLQNPVPGGSGGSGDADERDAMQLWFEARWVRLVAQRRARDLPAARPNEEPRAKMLAILEKRLSRPLSAEQQAATVAELVQVSAQHAAHQALMAAARRRAVDAPHTGKNPA